LSDWQVEAADANAGGRRESSGQRAQRERLRRARAGAFAQAVRRPDGRRNRPRPYIHGDGMVFPWLAACSSEPMRARAFALPGKATYLGGYLYPALAATLIATVGPGGAFIVLGAAMLVAAVTIAARLSKSDRPLRQDAEPKVA